MNHSREYSGRVLFARAPLLGLCFFVHMNTPHLGQRETVAKKVVVNSDVRNCDCDWPRARVDREGV